MALGFKKMEELKVATPVRNDDAAKARLEAERKARYEREEAEIDKLLDDLDLVLHRF